MGDPQKLTKYSVSPLQLFFYLITTSSVGSNPHNTAIYPAVLSHLYRLRLLFDPLWFFLSWKLDVTQKKLCTVIPDITAVDLNVPYYAKTSTPTFSNNDVCL